MRLRTAEDEPDTFLYVSVDDDLQFLSLRIFGGGGGAGGSAKI